MNTTFSTRWTFNTNLAAAYSYRALSSKMVHNRRVDPNDVEDIAATAALMFVRATENMLHTVWGSFGKFSDLSSDDLTRLCARFACKRAILYAARSRVETTEEIVEGATMTSSLEELLSADDGDSVRLTLEAIEGGMTKKVDIAAYAEVSRPTLNAILARLADRM